ncbi:MAG: antitoxin family protein [Acidobacteriota bacterium]|nr:antitoxin family protein [Acidobacteriota bacterium]
MKPIDAIFENGVFRPVEGSPPLLKEGQRVRLFTVSHGDEDDQGRSITERGMTETNEVERRVQGFSERPDGAWY